MHKWSVLVWNMSLLKPSKVKLVVVAGLAVVVGSLWLIPGPDRIGAMVVVSPNDRMSQQGQEWTANVRIVSNVPVNAADVLLRYPADLVEVQQVEADEVRFETSVFEPTHTSGRAEVHFVAATLEPHQGEGGSIGVIQFRAKKPGVSRISVAEAVVVRHDGNGTDVYQSDLQRTVGEWMLDMGRAGWNNLIGGGK
jgi:hypothetical protein